MAHDSNYLDRMLQLHGRSIDGIYRPAEGHVEAGKGHIIKTRYGVVAVAAIGSIPLDTARARGFTGKFQELLGIQIVTIAVLVILITAPIGAVAIAVAGPKFLKRNTDVLPLDKAENSEKECLNHPDECEKDETRM